MYTRTFVARTIGVHPNTLARWEERRVIDAPQRDNAGRRIYTSNDLARIGEIATSRRVGQPPKDRA
jgi:DNA-binding transcriptional MerR regulator